MNIKVSNENEAKDLQIQMLVVSDFLKSKFGFLTAEDIAQAKAAGLDDGLIVEIIANLVHNTLTNYTNHVAQTEIDFPVVPLEI